jgi:hypothetical protein
MPSVERAGGPLKHRSFMLNVGLAHGWPDGGGFFSSRGPFLIQHSCNPHGKGKDSTGDYAPSSIIYRELIWIGLMGPLVRMLIWDVRIGVTSI